ncbi:MAG: ABC transporter ATP-binding protein [Orrella sp.]
MSPIINVQHLVKSYADGARALDDVSLAIESGEVLALLGPNGAGKTTLISIICGLTTITDGTVSVGGFDVVKEYRQARSLIGLVPQELMLEPFETVLSTVSLSRGLFGCKPNQSHVEAVLSQLSLLDKKDAQIKELSGGMKRRVLIAKALSHDPKVLFLDEPTAGVDVELRRDMWSVIKALKRQGVTIVLTTHYIEEAEEIADRVAVINGGQILLVEQKDKLMKRLGTKELRIDLHEPISALPDSLVAFGVQPADDGMSLFYHYDVNAEITGISSLLSVLVSEGIVLKDLRTYQSSLEDIFLDLVTLENK